MKKAEQEEIRDLENSTEYNPSEWEQYLGAGCYPYALNLKINELVLVGDFIGKRCKEYTPSRVLIRVLKEELETIMGYEVEEVDIDYQAKEGEKKIYLIRYEHSGFYHFLREDSDKKWSHKYPKEMPNREDFYGKKLESPKRLSKKGWCFLLKKRKPE